MAIFSGSSYGSVKGRLERRNLVKCLAFMLYPPIPGHSVRCLFREGLCQIAQDACGKNVTVFCMLHSKAGRPFPESLLVTSMEVHPPDDELPNLTSLRGAWKCSS